MCCRIAIDYNSCFMLYSSGHPSRQGLFWYMVPVVFFFLVSLLTFHSLLSLFLFQSLQLLLSIALFLHSSLTRSSYLSQRSLPIAFSVSHVSVSPPFSAHLLSFFFISHSAHMTSNWFCKRHAYIHMLYYYDLRHAFEDIIYCKTWKRLHKYVSPWLLF